MRRPRYVPGRGGPGLAAAVFALSLLMGLAGIGLLAAGRAVVHTHAHLPGDAVLVFRGAGLESADAAAARAVEILSGKPGVKSLTVLPPAADDMEVAGLIDHRPPTDDPLMAPRLLRLDLNPGGSLGPSLSAIRAEGISVAADRPRAWSSRVTGSLLAVSAAAAAVFFVSLAWACVLVARRPMGLLKAQPSVCDLLMRLGADAGFLAREARGGLTLAIFASAMLGAAGAAGLAIAGQAYGDRRLAMPVPVKITHLDLAALAPWPLLILASFLIASSSAGRRILRSAA